MSQMLESTLMKHVRFLSETVGPRPVGSAAFHRAADYVRAAFDSAGLRVEELQHEIVDWQHNETILEVGGARLTARANVYSPPCDVTAPLLAVCSPAELEAADIGGKVVLFYGDLSNEYMIPLNCQVYNSDRDQRINRLLIERKPAAVLTVHPKVGGLDFALHGSRPADPLGDGSGRGWAGAAATTMMNSKQSISGSMPNPSPPLQGRSWG